MLRYGLNALFYTLCAVLSTKASTQIIWRPRLLGTAIFGDEVINLPFDLATATFDPTSAIVVKEPGVVLGPNGVPQLKLDPNDPLELSALQPGAVTVKEVKDKMIEIAKKVGEIDLPIVKIGEWCQEHRQCPAGAVCHPAGNFAEVFRYCVCIDGRPKTDAGGLQICPDGIKHEDKIKEKIEAALAKTKTTQADRPWRTTTVDDYVYDLDLSEVGGDHTRPTPKRPTTKIRTLKKTTTKTLATTTASTMKMLSDKEIIRIRLARLGYLKGADGLPLTTPGPFSYKVMKARWQTRLQEMKKNVLRLQQQPERSSSENQSQEFVHKFGPITTLHSAHNQSDWLSNRPKLHLLSENVRIHAHQILKQANARLLSKLNLGSTTALETTTQSQTVHFDTEHKELGQLLTKQNMAQILSALRKLIPLRRRTD